MEVVRDFNNELSSLYEVRPPISKAKMMSITKSAIKGIKFYKHIVQSVEKFIQKCRPEYKIPGLYVIDSIVRQSRHQFGPEKEVFGPRFVKNIVTTFQHLFHCEEEDRSKIVRVLNLWQKNNVFASDVIQPLLDMANPNSSGEWSAHDSTVPVQTGSPVKKAAPLVENVAPNSKHKSSESWKGWPSQNAEEIPVEPHSYSEMSVKNVEKFTKANSSGLPETVIPTAKNSEVKPPEDNAVKFNKKLLDFDYGDEEDEEEIKPDDGGQSALAYSISQNLLSNPELLRQLQQISSMQQNEDQPKIQQPGILPKETADHFSPAVPDCKIPGNMYMESQPPPAMYPYDNAMAFPPQPHMMPEPPKIEMPYPMEMLPTADEDERMMYSMPGEPPLPPQDLDERALVLGDDRIKKERSRSRSGSRGRGRSGRHRSRSRSPRRRKSRSRSRSRSRRNRSRSKDRDRERRKEREREKERERDRSKKGIPPIKKNCISICSTTLWLGHVPKTLAEEDIASTFADFGSVSSIDMIPPRGCAYVVMDRRQDAHRALTKLKNLKLQGSTIKMAWAPGKGTKGKEFKDYWEVELGVSYVPFEKIKDLSVLDALGEGGFIDEDSLPPHLREMRQQRENAKAAALDVHPTIVTSEKMIEKTGIITTATPTMPPTMLPANLGGLPCVLPQMMQPQFGMPLPGLLPPQSMVMQHMQMPVGVPPPNPLMMVQPPTQTMLAGAPLPVGAMPHLPLPHATVPMTMPPMASVVPVTEPLKETSLTASDATPTEEDGTQVQSPPMTSAPPIVTTQFNSVLAPRQLLPGNLPVSTSSSLPYPHPHVGFGFPPPGMRPGVPPQNSPAYSWQQKPPANFGGYGDADMRYPIGNRPPGKMPPTSQSTNGPPTSVAPSKDSVVPEKEPLLGLEPRNQEGFGGRVPPPKPFNRPHSPGPYDDHDMDLELPEGMPPDHYPPPGGGREEFMRDHGPRFPGPPDFHPGHGGMRGRWLPPPNSQRFLRPQGPQFSPRGPRLPYSRMEMDYFPPARMMGPNPRGHPPRRGGPNFPPSRNVPEHFGNRDFYDDERGRGHPSLPLREDWGPPPRHEPWDEPREPNRRLDEPREPNRRLDEPREPNRRLDEPREPRDLPRRTDEDARKPLPSTVRDKPQENIVNTPHEDVSKQTPAPKSEKSEVKEPPKEVKPVTLASEEPKSKPKPKTKKQSQNLMFDMMRLSNYGAKKKPLPKPSQPKKETKVVNTTEPPKNTEPVITIKEIIPEANNKRTGDRKRSSRWGRTLSEERELRKSTETNVNGNTDDPVPIEQETTDSIPRNESAENEVIEPINNNETSSNVENVTTIE